MTRKQTDGANPQETRGHGAGELRSELRRRIYGLETEYVILYAPDDPEDTERPPFAAIEDAVFSSLLAARKAVASSGIKGGYFIENGGLVHLEICVRDQSDTPILECSTPECTNPRDLTVYQRAFDRLLEEISVRSRAALLRRGYRGTIVFGKNNRDIRGVGYGCHENYLTYFSIPTRERWVYLAWLPAVFALLIPAMAFIFASVFVYLLVLFLARALPTFALRAFRFFERNPFGKSVRGLFNSAYHLVSNGLLLPALALYSRLLRRYILREPIRALSPFLATRSILAGSGHLDTAAGVYELSQRPSLTTTLGTIVILGRKKTVFDLKGYLYTPVAALRRKKKFTITSGDSNLSDIPVYLKTAATALVIEMIEDGVSFRDLELARPLDAFLEVSRGGPWKELELAGGRRLTAIDIQRAYLERARRHFGIGDSSSPEPAFDPATASSPAAVCALWAWVLDRLAERPQSLADALDWAAKKSILDRAILPQGGWKVFFAWARLFEAAGLECTGRAASLSDLLRRAPFRRRQLLRELARNLEPGEFHRRRELYYQARKIDLRYHEIGARRGYQRELEGDGLIRRLTTDEEVERATREPPRDTRARVRGYYIKLSPTPRAMSASWTEVELAAHERRIPLTDPFDCRLPEDSSPP